MHSARAESRSRPSKAATSCLSSIDVPWIRRMPASPVLDKERETPPAALSPFEGYWQSDDDPPAKASFQDRKVFLTEKGKLDRPSTASGPGQLSAVQENR